MNGRLDRLESPLIVWVLRVVAIVLATWSVARVIRCLTQDARVDAAQFKALGGDPNTNGDPNTAKKPDLLAADRKRAEALAKDNLIAPAPAKRNPVEQVQGILGNEALINGQWYKVGAQVGDAKVVAIGPVSVTIEWNGDETVLYPISGGGGDSSGGRGRGPSRGGPPPGASVTVIGGSRGGSGPGPGGPPGLSEGGRKKLESMSPEERRQFMQERFGGKGGPGRSSRGGN